MSVAELRRATDAGGMYFEAEILDYMKYGIWDLDFDADTVQEMWSTAREAGTVKRTAERYRGHGREALRLEKALEKISECLERQKGRKSEAVACLGRYDGPGFRREALRLIGELERMPGLVQEYEKQADNLASRLKQSWERSMREHGRTAQNRFSNFWNRRSGSMRLMWRRMESGGWRLKHYPVFLKSRDCLWNSVFRRRRRSRSGSIIGKMMRRMTARTWRRFGPRCAGISAICRFISCPFPMG